MIHSMHPRRSSSGFTLVELMISLVVLAVVIIALTAVVYTASRSKTSSSNRLESTQSARIAMDMMSRDLRNAGYGADLSATPPQPPIAYIDSLEFIINVNMNPYPDTTATPGWPLAYNPTAGLKPFHLSGTSWQPPMKYLTGAECIRWTMDLNNDGDVNAADIASANGVDAARTPNPNDYVLVRQVYGDSTGAVAGNNGATTERIALVARQTAGAPPLFTVYLNGSTDAWDWANGPIPSNQLRNITRVRVNVASESPKPDWRHQFARTEFRSDVNLQRNVPVLSGSTYDVDGYVFNDNTSPYGTRNGAEVGLAGAVVRLGMFTATTDASGYFYLTAPAGVYTLRHTPPIGFGVRTNPDSFVVTLGPDQVRSFADTAKAGGTVNCFAYEDKDGDNAYDPGEPGVPLSKFTITPSSQTVYADTAGYGQLFAPVGGYSVTCVPPDSFVVMSANPVSGTMTNGGTQSISFALVSGGFGYVRGNVYLDTNRNGYMDGGEQGIANVWVGVTPDGGLTVPGYAMTNASGAYTVKVPANDPPHTTPYTVMCIPPDGFYPTSATNIGPLWIRDGDSFAGNNFGMSSFQIITLNANRVLSLASRDLIEKDWPSSSTNLAHLDADIVLGADANGSDQVSVWFNQYNSTPLFNATPTYTRSAPQAVMSMAVDTLDGNAPKGRPDVVTGTKVAASGNFFVWFNQNSSGNEGYIPATYSTSQNYKTLDNGDVQAVLTYDCAGGSGADSPDIIVGSKSASTGFGSIEIWKSNNAATPAFTREEVYPTAGGLPGGALGEVTCMTLADFDGDGKRDLAVGTTQSAYRGQVLFFKFTNKNTTPHFTYMSTVNLSNDAVTSIATVDMDGDGYKDVVVGTQNGISSGRLIYLHNKIHGTHVFQEDQDVDAPGIVTSLLATDLGGDSTPDLAVGYRANTSGYAGGLRIYFLDAAAQAIPATGTDPSGGTITNMVPALTANDFNFGANPAAVAPFLTDIAAGVKSSATTGALVVFIR